MSPVFPLKLNLFQKKHLALQIKFSTQRMESIIDNQLAYIRQFDIMTKRNKKRLIIEPIAQYKKLLRNINKNLFNKAFLPKGICGGVVKKSLKEMVLIHCGKEAVYTVDLKDFYPNISIKRVIRFLSKANCSAEIAHLLAKLITFKGSLPQGFPTSTMMANLIAYQLDVEHLNICRKFNLARTRWVDDIVFSGRDKDLKLAISRINTAIKKNGFVINKKKANFTLRKNIPKIVGLVISNRKPRIPLEFIDKIREILLVAKTCGIEAARNINEISQEKKNISSSIWGKLKYIEQFNPRLAQELKGIYYSIDWK